MEHGAVGARWLPPGSARLATPTARGGVTLVELMITITILAIIGAAVLFASFSANRAARIAATRAKVVSLHALVMEKYDEFKTRRVKVDTPPVLNDAGYNLDAWKSQAILPRLRALRVLMRMEMPDRWSDIVLRSVEQLPPQGTSDLSAYPPRYDDTVVQVERTSLSWAYLRRYNSLKSTDVDVIENNQGAECLYMIISLATGDGEALSLFRESDIGDVDGDGAPEFLDAWGRPIHYLLAAPGFTTLSELQTADPINNHDPFDAFRVHDSAYRLVPLIYSAGPDGDPDIDTQKNFIALGKSMYGEQEGQAALVGRPLSDDGDGDNWIDNIHNHEKDVRQ